MFKDVKFEVPMYWYDYIVFVAVFIFSTLVGIYLGCFRKQQSTSDHLMGNRQMKALPVACSAVASVFSAFSMVGFPGEVYQYGAAQLLFSLITPLKSLIQGVFYLPVIYDLEVKSIYVYLNKRFDDKTQKLIALSCILMNLVIISTNIYMSILILSTATGMNFYSLVPIISGICIFYTAIGGFKSVIWTDTLQLIFCIVTVTATLVLGAQSAGGFPTAWDRATKGDRTNIFDFDLDPTNRNSFWAVTVGHTVQILAFTVTNQNHMQKLMTVPTLNQSFLALTYYTIGMIVIKIGCILTGILMYAHFSSCDKIGINNEIKSINQLVLMYVMDVGRNVPGFSGLYFAGLFSAVLSTQSALLNCSAGVIYEDFLGKFLQSKVSDKTAKNIMKLVVVLLGIISTLLVFVIVRLGNIFSLFISLIGTIIGPTLGVFTLGIFYHRANANGAFYGAICGWLLILSIAIPAKYYQYTGMVIYPAKPVLTDNCTFLNETTQFFSVDDNATEIYKSDNTTFTIDFESKKSQPAAIFRISMYYYTIIGAVVTLIIGILISVMTNKNDPPVDEKLLSPVVRYFINRKRVTTHENVLYSSVEKAKNDDPSDF